MGVGKAFRGGQGHRYRPAINCVSFLATWAALHAGTPVPTYGTFFGGTGDLNAAAAVAVDSSGNVIVAGYTPSPTLPGTANALQPTKATGFPDNWDVFIAKFDPTGRTLLWATFLGGADLDQPTAVAVDAAGSIYVIGTTRSSNFPVTPGAYIRSSSSGGGFAAKISSNGASLLYSTYLPGAANALAVNNAGEAYIVGTFSSTAITAGALNAGGANNQGDGGVSLLRLNAVGSGLVFGAYFGGGGFNGSVATSIVLDSQGDSYVAGFTAESNILTTANAFQGQYSNPGTGIPCCSNGFIVEVNPAGSQLLYGTYFGLKYFGTMIAGIAIAPDGALYMSGSTNSTTQATAGAYMGTPEASGAGFIAKLTPGRTTVDSFSYMPGTAIMAAGNQPETVYAAFGASSGQYGVPEGLSVVELSVPTLSLVSSFAQPTTGVAPTGLALAAPHSLWIAAGSFSSQGCPLCSLGNLISANAFQPAPATSSGGAVLCQLTDIAPTISFLGSSATGSSPFAAGQLISIYGTQLGPTPAAGAQVNSNGVVTNSNGGTQVLFDGIAAPILYTSATQVNTAIPCSAAGKASTQMVVQYLGAPSAPFAVPLSPAAP